VVGIFKIFILSKDRINIKNFFLLNQGLGTSLLSIAIKLIIKLYDWKYAMTFCALLFLICSCLGVLLRPKVLKIEKKNKLIQTKNEHPESESDGNKIFQTYGGSLLSFNIASVHDDETNDSSFKSILKKIADFNLLIENKAFLMMAISNFFIWASIFLPFIYLPKLHGQNDIENYWYQNLVSIIGLTNIFFRVIFGWIFDKKIFSSLIWHLICVVFTIAIVFMFKEILQHHYFGKYLFAICYAIGTGRRICFFLIVDNVKTIIMVNINLCNSWNNGSNYTESDRNSGFEKIWKLYWYFKYF